MFIIIMQIVYSDKLNCIKSASYDICTDLYNICTGKNNEPVL